MGLLFALPGAYAASRAATGLPSARDSKVPEPRQICNLNDHGTSLVPAKSVRKLIDPSVVSKKFLRLQTVKTGVL
jgi:hypothetical protein